MQTGRTPSGARENLGVLRARRALLNQRSWAGLMLTSRVTPDSGQVALGADGELHLGGDDYVGFALAALAGDAGVGPERRRAAPRRAPAPRGAAPQPRACGIAPASPPPAPATRRRWATSSGATPSSRWRRSATDGWSRRRGTSCAAALSSAFAYRNAAGTFEGSIASAALEYELPGGTLWTLTLTRQEDDLLVPFTPVPETSVPAGRHTAGFAELKLKPSTGPRAVVGGTVRAGEYYDGRLYSLLLSPEWRASAYLRLSADLQLDRLEFPDAGRAGLVPAGAPAGAGLGVARGSRSAPCSRPTAPPTSRPPTCACATR